MKQQQAEPRTGRTVEEPSPLDIAELAQALPHLVEAWRPLLLAVARRYVSSPESAEEVVQETWLAVWQRRFDFRGEAAFQTWVIAILVKRAQSWARRERRLIPFADWGLAEVDEDTAAHRRYRWQAGAGRDPQRWLGWNQERRSPEEQLLQRELMQHVHEELATLPTKQRKAIHLSAFEGRSSEEICETLGVSEVNQRVLLHRARTQMRRVLAHYWDE